MRPLVWLSGVVALAFLAFLVWRGSPRATTVAVGTASTSAASTGSGVLVDASGEDSHLTRREVAAPGASTAPPGEREPHPTNPPEAAARGPAGKARIVLAVTDERGEPLRNAVVTLHLADREGRHRASVPLDTGSLLREDDPAAAEKGRYSASIDLPRATSVRGEATVWASGFESNQIEFELHSSETMHATCTLTRRDPEIAGVVVDERGDAVGGLLLEARTGRDGTAECVASEGDGTFVFPDSYRENVIALLVRRDQRLVATISGSEVGLGMRIVVPAPARLSGLLIEPRGGLLPRARVQLSGSSANGTRTWLEPALVVEDGAFAFDPAPVGALELNVWREAEPGRWQHWLAFPLTLASGESRQLDVVVPALP
ncbi:MAG: hypothetical protein HZA52_04205 [Planctomycetes bacterium]|nr:hypothetical protein [Planctomycetota bacterium]